MTIGGSQRARLKLELALSKSRLDTLNRLFLMSEIEETRASLMDDIKQQEKVIAEFKTKLAGQ